MKHSKIFRISALAIVLALLVTAIPSTPALAQSAIASANTTLSGTTVSINGTGFTASSSVLIYFPNTSTLKTSASTDATGSFYAAFTIGEYPAGSKTVWVLDGIFYTASFTVTPVIGLSSSSGEVGDQITVAGTGFAANKTATITFHNVNVGTAETDANGSFTGATFTVPHSYRGSHTVKVLDTSTYYDTATFTTNQSISLSPTSGAVGDEVTVSGTGFAANKTATITFDGNTITTTPASVTTNNNGSFSNTTFTVPAAVNDTYEVEVSDGYYTDSVNFAVVAGVAISPVTSQTSPGYVGDEVTVSGTGFLASQTVTITYLSVPITVATTTTDANGAFSATFEVPASEGGNHTITATDGTNTITSTFTMESTPPAIPAPLLPLMDSKARAEAQFDWEDVTDPSLPVTYTLQIATDDQFTTASIVLEKTGITDSEYTLTSEEKLASVEKEAPYYWRVKAIDGASNESGWTGTGSFYVGFAFDWPSWLTYTLLGLGAVLLGVFGFWLGRRTAYY
jgi:hypothetical protein